MKNKTAFFLALFLTAIMMMQAPADAFLFWNFPKKEEQKKPELAAIQSLTLVEAYHLALRQSETVALSAEEINQARSRFYRSFDYFLPTVHFLMSRTERDTSGDSSASGISGDATRRVTPENKFTFTQPLFSGFKEIAALQGSGADREQQRQNWRRAKEVLFVDMMDAYYGLLKAQRDVQTLSATHRLGASRMRELNRKIKVGRLRVTEKQSALADLKLMEVDLAAARSMLAVSKNLFEFYIGQSLGSRVLVDERIPEEVFDFSQLLSRAASRSDVVAAEKGYFVSQKKVISAQADLFPTISASGNIYTRRVGFQSGNDWDVTVQMDVPIFEVGQTLGDIKEAVSNRESGRLLWQQAGRMARLDIQNAFEDLKSLRVRERALSTARSASAKNYELVSRDYNRSVVNNLDVLDALRRLEDVELRYNDAYFQLKESYWRLKLAVGEILNIPGVDPAGDKK